ncbi:MAG: translocation/assembly module TamB domain-containing protein [Saprospiraceae bacterium]|nr:translocation/assembly module TamB domain-containing protein [Saprospiraceae bacterium]
MSVLRGQSTRRWLRFLWRSLLGIVLLLILVLLLIQIVPVQNMIVDHFAKKISRDLDTEVSIDRIGFNFFKDFKLEGLLIKDPLGDTLLMADRVYLDAHNPLSALTQKELKISGIELEGAQVALTKGRRGNTNFDFLLNHLFPPSDASEGAPQPNATASTSTQKQGLAVLFAPAHLRLEDVGFTLQDSTSGKVTILHVPEGTARIEKHQNDRPLVIHDLELIRPYFSEVIEFDPYNLPPLRSSEASLTSSPNPVQDSMSTPRPDSIIIRNAVIEDGTINLVNVPNLKEIELEHVIDIADLDLLQVNGELTDFIFSEKTISSKVEHISFHTPEGFAVEHLAANNFSLHDTEMHMRDFVLETPTSRVQRDLTFRFNDIGDFRDFENLVRMDGYFTDSDVSIRDLLYFSTDLNENEFFLLNGGKVLNFDGRIYGLVNNLKTQKVTIRLEDMATIRGNIALRNVTVPGEELMNLNLSEARADIQTLRQLIPNFNLPPNYDKLGELRFSGNFDGFFEDFVAYGKLDTDLGLLETDLRMEFTGKSLEDASYSGSVDLINFDLGSWTDSEDFGRATFHASISNGQGFDVDAANGLVQAGLKSFEYRGYTYQNVQLEGDLKSKFFNGTLALDDPNASFDFDGTLDFTGVNPKYDFHAFVERLDFQKLNLSDEPFVFSGEVDFDFETFSLFDLDGHIVGYDLQLDVDTNSYFLDYIEAYSSVTDPNNKSIKIESEVLNFDISGKYDLANLPAVLSTLAHSKHPLMAKKLAVHERFDSLRSNDLVFDLHIKHSHGLEKILDPLLDTIQNLHISGNFLNEFDSTFQYDMKVDVPSLTLDNMEFNGVIGDLTGRDSESQWISSAEYIRFGRKRVQPLRVNTAFEKDRIFFEVSSENVLDALDTVEFIGALYLKDDLFVIDFEQGAFNLLGEPWALNRSNSLLVGDRYIKTDNLVFLAPDNSFFRINSSGNSDLVIEAEQVDISFLDQLVDFNDFTFDGRADLNLEFAHIFNDEDVNLNLRIDSVTLNDSLLGQLHTELHMDRFGDAAVFNFGLVGDSLSVLAEGDFFAPLRRSDKGKPLGFDIDLAVGALPLYISEFFIGTSIENTSGFLTGDARIVSEDGRPAIYGSAYLDGETTISYLGTTYAMNKQRVRLTPTEFKFDGVSMTDKQGNRAVFIGGLPHNHFKRFGLNAQVVSPKFIFLDTEKGDNDLFYGFGIGEGNVSFTGDFKATDISVRAKTGDGSKIYIPINEGYALDGEEFFRYVSDADSLALGGQVAEISGIDFDMELEVTPDAEIQIIFDEKAGEIIKGNGHGDLTVDVSRDGDFTMVGDYVIENGEYLFTYGGIVNKPFTVERGGQIVWSGDPYNADLNISAKYEGLRTAPKNLILEYLTTGSSTTSQLAEISTDVDLILKLRGILSTPEIDFEILFPEIDPSLRNLVDSKIRILREDPSELNRQVVGLLLLNTFLPPATNFDLTSTTVNTISELITSQLSNFVAAYLSEAVDDIDYISGIDFYFDYNFYRSIDVEQATNVKSGSEFAFAPNIRFFDDRLAFSPGVSVIDGTILQGSSFIGTDIQLDYFVTDDRRLKLSLFHKVFPALEGRRNKLGLGLRFFKDYDSYGEIFRREKKSKKPKEEDVGVK